MVEQGLVMLIQNGIASIVPGVPGGFAVQLPKDTIGQSQPMAWTYHSITSKPDYVLAGQTGWTEWCVQIDCHGNGMADAIRLARAIDGVLRGAFQGNLPDPDSTYVFSIYRQSPQVDGYSDTNRTFVRSLEYLVIYQQI